MKSEGLVAQSVKNPPAMQELQETGLILGSGRSPGRRHGSPLQYSCLENPMHRGAWQATVRRITKSQAQLKRFCKYASWFSFAYVCVYEIICLTFAFPTKWYSPHGRGPSFPRLYPKPYTVELFGIYWVNEWVNAQSPEKNNGVCLGWSGWKKDIYDSQQQNSCLQVLCFFFNLLFWLLWVFVAGLGLSPVAASRGCSLVAPWRNAFKRQA